MIAKVKSVAIVTEKTHHGAGSGGEFRISSEYIDEVSTAWLASLFGHEGQHYQNKGKFSGEDLWRDELSASAFQLELGRLLGFKYAEIDFLENIWMKDPARMQRHMITGYP